MASKRIISFSVVEGDSFIDMRLTSQLLYFHFLMNADNEGFVSNPTSIIRMIGASRANLNDLVNRNFIILFRAEKVVLITHWLVHNPSRFFYNECSFPGLADRVYISRDCLYTTESCYGIVKLSDFPEARRTLGNPAVKATLAKIASLAGDGIFRPIRRDVDVDVDVDVDADVNFDYDGDRTAPKARASASTGEGDEADKADRSEDVDKVEGADRSKEADKVEGADKAERSDKVEGADKAEKADKVEGADRSKEADKVEGTDKVERSDKVEGADKAERSDKVEGADRSKEADKVEGADRSKEADKVEGTDKAGGATVAYGEETFYYSFREGMEVVISASVRGALPEEIALADREPGEDEYELYGKGEKKVVKLTNKQASSLIGIMGFIEFNNYVERLSDFILSKNADIKNHYALILKWAREDGKADA